MIYIYKDISIIYQTSIFHIQYITIFCIFSIFCIFDLSFTVFEHFLSIYKEDRHVALTARSAVNATWRGDGITV